MKIERNDVMLISGVYAKNNQVLRVDPLCIREIQFGTDEAEIQRLLKEEFGHLEYDYYTMQSFPRIK